MNRTRGESPHWQQVAEIVRAASLLVSCRDCGKLYKPECPLDLHPICPACTGSYPMASLHMGARHPLNEAKIDEEVTRVSPGNDALGFVDDGTFVPFYVGRSDSVVDGRYTHFRFSYAASPQAALEKECCNYHDFGGSYGLDNERHPAPPEGESWTCPMHGHHHT